MRLKYYAVPKTGHGGNPFVRVSPDSNRKDPLEIQLDHFCNVIRGTELPLVSMRDGLRNLIITEAISEAARRGSIIEIDPI